MDRLAPCSEKRKNAATSYLASSVLNFFQIETPRRGARRGLHGENIQFVHSICLGNCRIDLLKFAFIRVHSWFEIFLQEIGAAGPLCPTEVEEVGKMPTLLVDTGGPPMPPLRRSGGSFARTFEDKGPGLFVLHEPQENRHIFLSLQS